MLPDEVWNNWWAKALGYVLLAAFGGTMGHMMRTIDNNQKIQWGRVALSGASAGFVGFLMLLLCQEFKLSEQWTGVIVGVFGWMGANTTILVLERIVLKRLGLNKIAQPLQDNQNDSRTE